MVGETVTVHGAIVSGFRKAASEFYKATGYHLRAYAVALDDGMFDRAAMVFVAHLHMRDKDTKAEAVELRSVLGAGFFDSEIDGVPCRISKWSAIK